MLGLLGERTLLSVNAVLPLIINKLKTITGSHSSNLCESFFMSYSISDYKLMSLKPELKKNNLLEYTSLQVILLVASPSCFCLCSCQWSPGRWTLSACKWTHGYSVNYLQSRSTPPPCHVIHLNLSKYQVEWIFTDALRFSLAYLEMQWIRCVEKRCYNVLHKRNWTILSPLAIYFQTRVWDVLFKSSESLL